MKPLERAVRAGRVLVTVISDLILTIILAVASFAGGVYVALHFQFSDIMITSSTAQDLSWFAGIHEPLFVTEYLFPTFFTTVWLWLYAGSGFLLIAGRRFQIGFQWFIRWADIEKKPLNCIGFVAGNLAALVYWAAVIVRHIVRF